MALSVNKVISYRPVFSGGQKPENSHEQKGFIPETLKKPVYVGAAALAVIAIAGIALSRGKGSEARSATKSFREAVISTLESNFPEKFTEVSDISRYLNKKGPKGATRLDVKDGTGAAASFFYNTERKLTQFAEWTPEGEVAQFGRFNEAGQDIQRWTADDDILVGNTYDELQRLVKKNISDGKEMTFEYRGNSNKLLKTVTTQDDKEVFSQENVYSKLGFLKEKKVFDAETGETTVTKYNFFGKAKKPVEAAKETVE